ncbi:MAG: UDP-N-acetylglucosamine 1-carboxyvinyltransferase [Candidatus Uhrbacteria bacterium]
MHFTIQGPSHIHGSISVAGAKNEALPLLAASVICDGPLTISRIPFIEDVSRMIEVMAALGIRVDRGTAGSCTVDASSCTTSTLPDALASRLRASIILLGPLLARFGTASLPQPGGCAIGRRPIDLFIQGFRAFGITTTEEPTQTTFVGKAQAARFVFPVVSVTGTETLLLLAARTPGTSVLENAAMEPEVTALAEFLSACGVDIQGIGSPTLTITGTEHISGGSVTCIPDRIETGAFASMVAACGGSLEIHDCNPKHVAVLLGLLSAMGASVETQDDSLRISVLEPLKALSFRTHEYPGLATDSQPPLTVALTQANGIALVHETIYEGRLFFIDKLNKMGANIILCDPHRCVVEGPRRLFGTRLESPDIRAGIALVIAAAAAEGESVIENVYQIDRGFEHIEERLRGIGVQIQRAEDV